MIYCQEFVYDWTNLWLTPKLLYKNEKNVSKSLKNLIIHYTLKEKKESVQSCLLINQWTICLIIWKSGIFTT